MEHILLRGTGASKSELGRHVRIGMKIPLIGFRLDSAEEKAEFYRYLVFHPFWVYTSI